MDPRFVYEVRFTDVECNVLKSRLFHQLQTAREYIYSLTEADSEGYQIVYVESGEIDVDYCFNCLVSLYRVPVSDSIDDHSKSTRLLLYETSPEDQYLFEYIQTEHKGYTSYYKIRKHIEIQNKLVDKIKPLIVQSFGQDVAGIIVDYIQIPINLDKLAGQLKRLSDSMALESREDLRGCVSYSALM